MGGPMPVTLQDQTALVVGASSGIGRATAESLARQGVRVMACARREERLRALQKQLADETIDAAIFVADAAKPGDAERMAAAAHEEFGKIDILVYAAGTNSPDRSLRRITPGIWNTM